MASLLIGTVRPNGRIQFSEKENPWVFNTIAASKNPIERIKVVPTLQPIEIKSNKGDEETFPWIGEFKDLIQTADAVFLSHKDGVLRFGSAMHSLDSSRKCFMIGTMQEAQKFATERWNNLRYFFAHKHDEFRFHLTTMMTYKSGKVLGDAPNIEFPIRFDTLEDGDDILPLFEATGSNSPVEIVDWRKTVESGAVGRFAVDGRRIVMSVSRLSRPFVFMEEFREEFKNHSYTFDREKFKPRLKKLVAKRLNEKKTETSV